MQQYSLNGLWKVSYVPYKSSIEKILSEHFVPEGWIDAQVPELIQGTLQRLGYITTHFYGRDSEEIRWMEEVDWVYYKQFYIDEGFCKEKVFLRFEGLDTFCDIYLNGEQIGHGENMHVPVCIDVTQKLQYGCRNVIVVRFYSPVRYVEGRDTRELYSPHPIERLWARKAQMNYSWDFCGRCVTTGIWKDVQVVAYEQSYIDSYYVYTMEISDTQAILGLEVDVNTDIQPKEAYELEVEITDKSQCIYRYRSGYKDFERMDIPIENPKLWWPRPYGEAYLYNFTLKLIKNDTVIDEKAQKFGVRTVKIIQEDQEDGKSYIFCVNGRRLFVRGSNWVPMHVIYTNIQKEDYEEYLTYAEEGNLSMLRIWGGGIYEPELFFQLCDEKGIMVWQDFMLACGMYPQEQEFLETIYHEAVHIIKKYRNYTSLVLWCGDNENDLSCSWAAKPYEFFNDKINRGVLMDACKEYDPHRIYVPSSPYSPFEFYKGGDNPKSPYQGDMHTYITHLDPDSKTYYKRIRYYRPRFMSEFGFMSLPQKDTYFRYNFFKNELEQFDIIKKRFPGFENYMPDGNHHEQIIYSTQEYQAYALKYWIEYFRSLKWICAGALYWKFNDPVADSHPTRLFPGLCAVVDFYRMPKMAYYFTKRAFGDVILALVEDKNKWMVYGCNETNDEQKGTLTLEHKDFSGNLLKKIQMDCTIQPDCSQVLYTIALADISVRDKLSEYMKVQFKSKELTIENRYFFVDIKDFYKLNLKKSTFEWIKLKKEDAFLYVSLKSKEYARNLRLTIPGQKALYEDNYFDLEAGEEKRVKIKLLGKTDMNEKVLSIEAKNVDRISIPLAKTEKVKG